MGHIEHDLVRRTRTWEEQAAFRPFYITFCKFLQLIVSSPDLLERSLKIFQ